MRTMTLDCTLRDGGYCNDWLFGHDNIVKIIQSLSDADVDIIECGFLTNRVKYNQDITKYERLNDLDALLKETNINGRKRQYVVMVNYNEYDVADLPPKTKDIFIDGIRLAFHKKDLRNALEQAKIISEKGYSLYLQPMLSLSYTDDEFLELIAESNKRRPYAIYIVDSFGTMKRKDLARLFFLIDHNLDRQIYIGFHSHNNMQLAFANAQMLTDYHAMHDLIVDCSIYGMGRGAGNLNTELFLDYLNENFGAHYDIKPLIKVIDRVLDAFYKENYWGYSLPNYLSASHNAHPNYATFLADKNALNVEDMDAILGMMEYGKKLVYDKAYAEELYTKYLSSGKIYSEHREQLDNALNGSTVLLIAPGRSSFEERDKIAAFADNNNVFVISINHKYEYRIPDYIFVSNLRRFRELDNVDYGKCIVTSNISTADAFLRTEYGELLIDNECVRDNAGLMAVKFLIRCGVEEIVLAGFDGYSHDSSENYANKELVLVTKRAFVDAMNKGMEMELLKCKERIGIWQLTHPQHFAIK